MLRCGHILLCFVGFPALFAHAQESTSQLPVFRSEVHLVTFTFGVRNAGGNVVSGLNQSDFTVEEDGVPQKTAAFARESQLPLSIGLLIDVSSSQDKFLKRHTHDIKLFLQQVLRTQDQAFALCFGDHLRLASDLTSSPEEIEQGLHHFTKSTADVPELSPDESREGGTALYDAVYSSVQLKLSGAGTRRRVLVLFTDGEENSSAHDEIDAIAAAQDADVLIYAVRYTEAHHEKLTAHNRHGIAALHHLAAQTGGTDFDGLHTDLPEAFRQIAEELRSLYSISYYSTNKANDGSFRKVVIQPAQSELTVRAKAGYYARSR